MNTSRTACAALLAAVASLGPVAPGPAQASPSRQATSSAGAGLSVSAPDRVGTGQTVTVTGSTSDTGTVRILFRKRDQSRFTVRRTLTPAAGGTFTATYVADDDYRLYAQTDRSTSPLELVVAVPVVHAPATARRGARVPVTVRAAAGTAVSVSFRGAGRTTFVVRRTGRTDGSGRYRTSYLADTDHRYYADEGGAQRSDTVLTQVQTPRSLTVSNDPASRGQVVALDAPAVFVPGAPVSISLTGHDGRSWQIGLVRAGRDGSFSTEVMIPTRAAPGRATLRASSGDRRAGGALYVS